MLVAAFTGSIEDMKFDWFNNKEMECQNIKYEYISTINDKTEYRRVNYHNAGTASIIPASGIEYLDYFAQKYQERDRR